jgi:hypothetical protein
MVSPAPASIRSRKIATNSVPPMRSSLAFPADGVGGRSGHRRGYGENALEAIGQMSDDPLIGLRAVGRRSSRPVPENAATKPSVTPGGHDGSRRPIQLVPEARRSVVHI